MSADGSSSGSDPDNSRPAKRLPARPLVLVGLMGAGKSAIGRRLAGRLGIPFVDVDAEIEKAAGCSISDYFERYGEAAFRVGERKVISRLLDGPVAVLASGGGAYMDAETRALIGEKAISVWLRAELDVLVERTSRRNDRPLLHRGDPRAILADLMDKRYPIYSQADIVVDSDEGPADQMTRRVVGAVRRHLNRHPELAAPC